MRFAILGPLEISDGERSIEMHPPMERALLGVLIVHGGEVLAVDVLVDALWGAALPAQPKAALQFHVSKLRAMLGSGSDVVATQPPGYVLDVDAAAIDANRFKRMAREGRALAHTDPRPAAALLSEALGMWRGEALIDFADQPWAANFIAELNGLRLSARCTRIDIEIAAERAADVIPELRDLTEQHPLHEALWSQLVQALGAADRRIEALMAYREAARLLAAEGLKPSPRLRRAAEFVKGAGVPVRPSF